MAYENLLEKASESINDLRPDTQFHLKDLFIGTEWNDLSKGDKLNFGKTFKKDVKDGKIRNVQYIGKTNNNSALYKKN
ncbi:MAG: DUF1413 domain-containing protein [Oscillospiraceae bacterium]